MFLNKCCENQPVQVVGLIIEISAAKIKDRICQLKYTKFHHDHPTGDHFLG